MNSPIRDVHRRFEMRNASTQAVAKALRESTSYARSLTERNQLKSMARRMEACGVSARYSLKNLPGPPLQPTRLIVHNNRACRIRWCAQCEGFRAHALSCSVAALLPYIQAIAPDVRFLFLTLTTKNRLLTDEGLSGMYSDHMAGVRRLFDRSLIRAATLGHFTALEIAVRERDGVKMAGVHSHSLVAVSGSHYFGSGQPLLHQTVWRDEWRSAAKLEYRPVVDVRAVKGADGLHDLAGAQRLTKELLKYVIKPQNFFEHRNGTITVDPLIVLTLSRVLRRQRITRFDRIFMAANKRRKIRLKEQAAANAAAWTTDDDCPF